MSASFPDGPARTWLYDEIQDPDERSFWREVFDRLEDLYSPRARPVFVRCPRPGCLRRAEFRDGEPPTSRGLAVGTLPFAACQPPRDGRHEKTDEEGRRVRDADGAVVMVGEVHILPSIVLRCKEHGHVAVYHTDEHLPGGHRRCVQCVVVPRLRLELRTRVHRAGYEAQGPASLRDGYPQIIG